MLKPSRKVVRAIRPRTGCRSVKLFGNTTINIRHEVDGLRVYDRISLNVDTLGRGRESDQAMSTYQTDARVDQYINSLPDWQQDICRRVRDLVHAADPDVTETIKRTRQPYFTLKGNICALLGAKDHMNVFIYDPIAPDPAGIINQGHGNQTARAIQIRRGETINETALLTLFRAVIANNRAGGWRKIKSEVTQ